MHEKNSIFGKSIQNLTEVKETEKFMDADMREFGKRSFLVSKKIEKLIFVTAHKTTGSHLKAVTAKKLKSVLQLNRIVLLDLTTGFFSA